MTILVESIKRLYTDEKVTAEKIEQLLREKKINKEEYDYIISK